MPSTEISTPKVAEVSAPNVATSSLRDNISATTLEVLGTLGGIGIGVGAGYALRRKYGKKPNQEELEKAYYSPEATITPLDNTPAHTIPNTSTSHSFPTPSTPTSHKKGDAPISTPQNTDIFAHPVPSRNGASLEKIQEEIRSLPVKEQQTILHQLSDCPDEVRDRMARLNAAAYAFQMKLGFSAPKMQMSAEVYGTVTYTLPTIGGEYKIQFFQEE